VTSDAALACVEDFARRADAQGVDLLLFPECFRDVAGLR
jgi:predicted amidohydrolase